MLFRSQNIAGLDCLTLRYIHAQGTTIISASSLSFLGIGVPAPAPEWGALLSGGRAHIRGASSICVIPGLAIMFTVLALNLLGDGLRDALDPKLKK